MYCETCLSYKLAKIWFKLAQIMHLKDFWVPLGPVTSLWSRINNLIWKLIWFAMVRMSIFCPCRYCEAFLYSKSVQISKNEIQIYINYWVPKLFCSKELLYIIVSICKVRLGQLHHCDPKSIIWFGNSNIERCYKLGSFNSFHWNGI